MLTLFRFRLPAAVRLGFLVLVGLLTARGAAGQGTPGWSLAEYPYWKWQNPRPQGFGLHDIWSFGDSAALAVGEWGTALRTADAGRTWQRVNVGTTNELRRIAFATPQLGWIAAHTPRMPGAAPSFYYGPGELRRTTDGGQTWQRLMDIEPLTATLKTVRVLNLDATSATSAWLLYNYAYETRNGVTLGEPRLRRTTNAGQTWPRVTVPYVEICEAQFVSATTGFLVGYVYQGIPHGYVYRTTDGGQTWREIAPDTTRDYTTVHFTDPLHGWVAGSLDNGTPKAYKTADGGQTWQPMVVDAGFGRPLGVGKLTFAPDRLHGVAYTEAGRLVTADGGLSWQQTTGEPNFASVLHLRNSGAGWSISVPQPDVQRTADYGATWARADSSLVPAEQLLPAVAFPDPAHGWTYSIDQYFPSTPRVLRTTRRGEPWQVLPLNAATTGLPAWNENVTLTGGAFPDADTAYLSATTDRHISGGVGWLMRTTNGGQQWVATPAPRGSRGLNRLSFANTRRGLLLADSGLYVTQNGGGQWRLAAPSPPRGRWNALAWADARTAYVTGDSLTLLRSVDGGLTWQDEPGLRAFFQQTGPVLNYQTFSNFAFATATTGCIASGGAIYRTTDGGRTWQTPLLTAPGTPDPGLGTCSFASARVGWAIGDIRYRTTDGGQTWTPLGPSVRMGTYFPALVDAYNGWVVGNYGRITHYSEKFIQTDTALARTSFCLGAGAGDSLAVPFTLEGTFSAAEQDFRVELSNRMGRFRPGETRFVGRGPASPILARLPATLPAGTYRLRVIRADSSVLGGDNGVDLRITQRPTAVTLTPADSVAICAGDSVRLTAPAGFGVYQWSTGATTPAVWVRAAGAYAVRVGGALDCLSPASDLVRVRVKPVPSRPIITVAPQPSGLVVLTSSAAAGNQWLLNGAPIAGAIGPTYTVSTAAQSGSYAVQVTRGGCASPVAMAVPVTVTGIADETGTGAVSISPNPARGHVTVRAARGATLVGVTLTDLSGREVARVAGASGETVVPLAGVASGTYLLRTDLASGAATTRRLVVEK